MCLSYDQAINIAEIKFPLISCRKNDDEDIQSSKNLANCSYFIFFAHKSSSVFSKKECQSFFSKQDY